MANPTVKFALRAGTALTRSPLPPRWASSVRLPDYRRVGAGFEIVNRPVDPSAQERPPFDPPKSRGCSVGKGYARPTC